MKALTGEGWGISNSLLIRKLTFNSRKYKINALIPMAARIVTTVKAINALLSGQFNVTMHGESSTHASQPGWHLMH